MMKSRPLVWALALTGAAAVALPAFAQLGKGLEAVQSGGELDRGVRACISASSGPKETIEGHHTKAAAPISMAVQDRID